MDDAIRLRLINKHINTINGYMMLNCDTIVESLALASALLQCSFQILSTTTGNPAEAYNIIIEQFKNVCGHPGEEKKDETI